MEPMKAEERQKLIDRFGVNWADQKQWEAYVTGAFNDVRPAGKYYRLFTDWRTNDHDEGQFQVWLMQAGFDPAFPTYVKGTVVTLSKAATYADIHAAMSGALKDEEDWKPEVNWSKD